MELLVKQLIKAGLVQTQGGQANQLLLTMTVSLGYLTVGLIRGWSSPGIPSMLQKSPHLVPTDSATSWVSAVPPLGAFCGSLVIGPFLQKLGRKKTLMISAPIFTFSWLVIGGAVNTIMLVAGRMLSGFCAGIVIPSAQVYVSECAHPEVRGVLGSLPALFMALGVLISYVIGAFLPWDYLAFISALFPAALFVFIIPLPESPSWLHSQGRKDEADNSAKWLHHDKVVNLELYTIPNNNGDAESPKTLKEIERKPEIPRGAAKAIAKGAYSTEALLRRPVLIPFGLVSAIMIFQQVSGIDTVLFYTVSIFEDSGGFVNDYLATILVGIVQVVATLVSLFVIDHYGRKLLLLFSGFFMAISMAALGFYFYVHDRQLPITESLGLLPVVSLMVFTAAYSIGYCNIPFLLMGELLPVGQRSILSSIASAFNLGAMFLVIKSYHNIKGWIGDEGVFSGYAVLCIISCIFVLFLLPETKGKSLEEIEGFFERRAERRKEKLTQKTNLQLQS